MISTAMDDQKNLIDLKDWDYLVICDGGRTDVFEKLAPRYLSGEYQKVWNRNHGYTANWFSEMFDGEYDAHCYHGGLPIHAFRQNPSDYDERGHFSEVAGYDRYEWDDDFQTCPPEGVTKLVHKDNPDKAVIRYLQPHNPYRDIEHIGSRSDAKEYSPTELREAYIDNYEWVLSEISDNLIPELEGKIVITSDHGQCFGDCGQYLHHYNHDPHDHLVKVPWLEL